MRKLSEEKEREFAELAAYVSFYATYMWKLPPEAPSHPSNFLKAIPGKATRSQILAGLRQAANDTVEGTEHLKPQEVAELDEACRSANALTFSEVRQRFWRGYKKVLKAGRIRNETEYYLIVGVTNDMASSISSDERLQLQALVITYEQDLAQPTVQADGPASGGPAV